MDHTPYRSPTSSDLLTGQDRGHLSLALPLKTTPFSLLSLQDTWHHLFNESNCLLQLVHSDLSETILEPGADKIWPLARNGWREE